MYKVTVWDVCSSAHFLRKYKGKCEKLHGHNWKVSVSILSDRLNLKGMVIDFKELKKMLKDVLGVLDHTCLNELDYFKKVNPTSENMAKYIHRHLKLKLKSKGYKRLEVSVWETETSCASFTR